MQGQYDIGAIIRLDGEGEFKAAVTNVNRSLNTMKAELTIIKEQYNGQANGIEALSKKQEIYAKILQEQKNKVERTSEGLENAKKVYADLGENVKKASQALENERKKLNEMKASADGSSDAMQKQEQKIEELQRALMKGNANYEKQAGRIKDWEAKLKNAEAQVIKANKQLDENAKYLKEAKNATDKHATSIDGYGKKVKEAEEITVRWNEAMKAGIAGRAVEAGVGALEEVGKATLGAAVDAEKAEKQIEASAEASGKALEQYKDVLKEVYAENYGDSLEDVSEVITKVTQNLGELDKEDLRNVTENAITLRDTFDMDLNETLRGAKNLMYQFELSATEAFDMIGAGAKAGLNYTDELGDNISEYGGNFAQAGYSAKEYFQLLENGTDNGAYNLDKVNDAINEVTNRLADGTVEDSINIYSEGTQNLFREWQNGGATQKQVIDSIVADIGNCKNEQEALTMAATAFGTMGEDGNLKFVESLTSVGNTFENVKGKMEEIKSVKYDDIGSRITEIGRSIQMQLINRLEQALPIVKDGLEIIDENLDLTIAGVTGLGTAVGLNKLFKSGFFTSAIDGAAALAKGLGKAEAAQKLLNLTTSATPWGAIAGAIGVATAALVAYAIATNDAKTEAEKQADEIERIADASNDLKNKIQESKEVFEETKGSVEAENGALQIMANRLYELSGSEEASNGKKAEMKALVDQLNEAMPELNLAIDDQTGKLNQGKEAVDAYIESLRKEAVAEAFGDRIKEMSTQIAEAEINMAEAEKKKAEATAALKEAEEERDRLLEKNPEVTDAVSLKIEELNQQIALYKENAKKCNEVIEEQNGIAKDNEKEMESLSGTIEKVQEKTEGATEAQKQYTQTVDASASSTEAQKAALESMQEKYEEIKDSIQQSMENKINLFSAFEGGDEASLDEMLENLESQLEGLEGWKSNMERLAAEVGDTIGPELYQYLSDLGPEAANAVDEMVEALDSGDEEKLEKISKKYAKVLDISEEASEQIANAKMAIEAALGELGSSEMDFSDLRESIDEAVQSAAEGWNGLPDETRAALERAIQTAKECGIQIPDGLADGIRNGEISPQQAIEQLNGSLQGQFAFLSSLAQEAGIQIPADIQTGIAQGGSAAIQAMQELVGLLTQEQQKGEQPSQDAGRKNMQAAGSGMASQAANVSASAGNVMQTAANTANAYRDSFYQVGTNVMAGTVAGMAANSPAVANEARRAMANALQAAKNEAQVKSPARKWKKELGEMLTKGTAEGIKDGTKDAEKSAKDMAASTLKAAEKELEINSPSKKFREKVGKQITAGTAFGIRDNKKAAEKEAEKMAKDVYRAAEKWIKKNGKTKGTGLKGAQNEKYYWEQVKKHLKEGTDAYEKAEKKISEAKEKIEKKRDEIQEKREYGLSGNGLDAYKTYYDVSAKAEEQYWDIVRKQFKKGTQERIEADQKYFEAKEDYNEKRKELEDDYLEKCSDVQEKLTEQIKDLTSEYEEAFEDRKKSIKNSFGTFDAFESEAESPETLLKNMQSQVAGYALWMQQLEELSSKGILNSTFMEELREMGPEAAATILSLNMMTEEQLKQANEAWEEKDRLAEAQAQRETEAIRKQTEDKIKELKKAAQEEMDAYKKEYEAASEQLSAAIEKPLKNLAKKATKIGENATAKLISGIKNGAEKKSTEKELKKATEQIAQGMNDLPAKGKDIGKQMLAGILEGLSNKLTIQAGAESFIEELEKAIKKSAEINSPSKRFRRSIGPHIPEGVAEGIKDGTKDAEKAGTEMVQSVLERTKNAAKERWEGVAAYAKSINAGARIDALNTLVSTPTQMTNITVDNAGVEEVMGEIVAGLMDLKNAVKGLRVVLDTGETVGRISEKVGNELAARARRWSR